MIGNRTEYERMYEVERKLWWYQTLHRQVVKQIAKHFGNNRQIRILDAACGTGGLLSFLREKGYGLIQGFDFSADAVEFSLERQLKVSFGDLRHVDAYKPDERFDVICCNDALYFLNDDEIVKALEIFRERLLPGGRMIINIHAFEAFSGTHDIAIGSTRRFTLPDFKKYAKEAGLQIEHHTYWPFFLSPAILAVRQWQKRKLQTTGTVHADIDSDVSYPGDTVNGILNFISKTEHALFPTAPFGSSLFMVLKPNVA